MKLLNMTLKCKLIVMYLHVVDIKFTQLIFYMLVCCKITCKCQILKFHGLLNFLVFKNFGFTYVNYFKFYK